MMQMHHLGNRWGWLGWQDAWLCEEPILETILLQRIFLKSNVRETGSQMYIYCRRNKAAPQCSPGATFLVTQPP
jgi:hypothetical protein